MKNLCKFIFITLCILIICGNTCYSATNCRKVEQQKCNIKGKNCWVYKTFEYDDLGYTIVYLTPFRNKFLSIIGFLSNWSGYHSRTKLMYDKLGNWIGEIHCKSKDFSDCKNKKIINNKYRYDKNGNISFEILGSKVYKYIYDNKNNMIARTFKDDNKKEVIDRYEYDKNNNKIAEYYCKDGSCYQYAGYKYDKYGNIIERKYDCKNLNDCHSVSHYENIYKNNVLRKVRYYGRDKSGKCYGQDEYDNRGNKIKENFTCDTDNAEEKHYHTPARYEYDKNNNLIAKYHCRTNSIDTVSIYTGRKTKTYEYDENNCDVLINKYKYDKLGNVIEEEVYILNENTGKKVRFDSTYILKTKYECN